MNNPYKKPHTTIFIIFEVMRHSYLTGEEFDITNLCNGFGESIPRASISMYLNKIRNDNFDVDFYTRTKNGRLFLGCYQPKESDKNKNAAQNILGFIS